MVTSQFTNIFEKLDVEKLEMKGNDDDQDDNIMINRMNVLLVLVYQKQQYPIFDIRYDDDDDDDDSIL